ncbi:hypothetical protein PVAG01_10165 [Phlyctema vagabunda]|uniref:Glucose receptor Git3-like N-terminal domain-containing protein n=1 Tax=Phlyctema vagabunda TaxID=108571 RepID=A0ABR4P561_9HELO
MMDIETKIKLGLGGSTVSRLKMLNLASLLVIMMITDIIKSLAYIALPLAALAGAKVKTGSEYCQFSGFIMAITVECTDYIMIVLVVQTALLVFRQYHDLQFGGLYPFRKLIYFFWIFLPGLNASLAFVNPNGGYAYLGPFCYLPRDPFWYRLTLAWIPRGCVFFIVLTLHSAIYIHTMRSLKEFKKVDSHLAQSGFSGNKHIIDSQYSYQPPTEFITSCVLIEPGEWYGVEDYVEVRQSQIIS